MKMRSSSIVRLDAACATAEVRASAAWLWWREIPSAAARLHRW
jgi:hypothetical protein